MIKSSRIIMNKNLVIALCIIVIAQCLTFLQLQGQFISEWMRKNTLLVSLLGIVISYSLLKFTHYCALAFDGQVWPGRLIGFAIGVMVFTVGSKFLLEESVNAKTAICLVLSAMILLVQIFWK